MGWAIIAEALKVIPGTIQSCSAILKENNLLAISPGGVYEAQFSDSYYRLMWKKRLGFARVALDAKVPIIPIFTQNVRESFRAVGFFRRIWLKLYTWTKFPLVPIYGGFPVKLRTHVGAPILYDSSLSPEDLDAEEADGDIEDPVMSHGDAVTKLNELMVYFERQAETSPAELLMLKRLRDRTARKRQTTLAQPKLTEFFTRK
ncbi:Transmembrane protein 68 [Homalodisca vitripennis]|nr:Transmembrane protein 68 [Homalodisca vitripennis]